MQTTFIQLATDAFLALGVVGEENAPTNGQMQLALRCFNRLIDAWQTDRLLLYSLSRTVVPLVADQASYTVGDGGDIDIPRPTTMQDNGSNVAYIDTTQSPECEIGLTQLTDDAYQGIVQKELGSTYPTAFYYNPTYTPADPYGTLHLWPVPNVGTLELVLYTPKQYGTYAVTDTLSFPQGYERFLVSNLAMELTIWYPAVRASDDLQRVARESKGDVERMNTRMVELSVDAALLPVPRISNFYTGGA